MRVFKFIIILITIFSCQKEKAKVNLNCDINIESILEQYTSESLSNDKFITNDPLLQISFSSDGKLKGHVKKVRLKRYKYDKRFDEDHWDLTFNETTEFNQNKNPIKIYRDRYIKEISYDSTFKSRSILSFEVDSTSYNGANNSAPGFKLKLSTETKNNNEIIIVNKEKSLLGGNFYNYSYLLSNEYKQQLKKILNKDLSSPNLISISKTYEDSLGRVFKKIKYTPKFRGRFGWEKSSIYTQDSVVFKYNRLDRGYKSTYPRKTIKKYAADGKSFIEANIFFNTYYNLLINNRSHKPLMVGTDMSSSQILFKFDNNCRVSKITSVIREGKCSKLEFNEHSDILKIVSYKTPGNNTSYILSYDENYEELLKKDFDLMRLSEYSWSTYNNYKYDSIGNWTQRTRITNIVGYPGTIRIKEKREIEYY